MTSRVALIGVLLAAHLGGCRDDLLTGVYSDVSLRPERIEFGQAWIGSPTEREITLTNRSRAGHSIRVSAPAPFSVEPSELELGGGAEAVLRVSFDPGSEGAFERVLTVVISGETREIPLTATALAPPLCAATGACVLVAFDPVSGTCVSSPAPQDAPCSVGSACVVNGKCSGGVCRGEALDCNDGNPCTLDACDPSDGCVHRDGVGACPHPTSPCEVAFCDSVTGCGIAPVADGTACGPADCLTAQVCVSGACVARAVPEGAACATGSPCQPMGKCQSGDCVQPAPVPLAPVWEHGPLWGIVFEGVADDQDNIYWTECVAVAGCSGSACTQCWVVSADRDGVERWREQQTTVRGQNVASSEQLLSGGTLVTFVGDHVVEARRAIDGSLLWTRDLYTELGPTFFSPTEPHADRTAVIRNPGADPAGALFVPIAFWNVRPGGTKASVLLALDAQTGATRWTSGLSGGVFETAIDEAGNVYVGETVSSLPDPLNHLLHALTPSGVVRWELSTERLRDPSVGGGRMVFDGSSVIDSASGTAAWAAAERALGDVLIAGGSSWSIAWNTGEGRGELVRRDTMTGTETWRAQFPTDTLLAEPILTAADSALIPIQRVSPAADASMWAVVELDPLGQETFSCDLPATVGTAWRTTLLRDRIVVQIMDGSGGWKLAAYDLPGRSLRKTGWVTPGGSNARSRAAR